MPESEPLLDRLRAGDEKAFRELVQRHHGPLRRLARSITGDAAAADEVVQDTWAAALDSLEGFEGRSTLKTWLFRICVNRARTRRERDRRQTPLSALEGDEGEGPAVDPERFAPDGHWADPPEGFSGLSPEKAALRGELRERLEAAVAALPERLRLVLTLRDVDGLDGAEVCNVMEITESNQRVLLHRARSKVRAALEGYLAGKEEA